MPTPEELKRAYEAFRIPTGTPWSEVKERYKTLVKLLHPDKHGSEESKLSAGEELKFYNEQFEVFKTHFQLSGDHREDDSCACKARARDQLGPVITGAGGTTTMSDHAPGMRYLAIAGMVAAVSLTAVFICFALAPPPERPHSTLETRPVRGTRTVEGENTATDSSASGRLPASVKTHPRSRKTPPQPAFPDARQERSRSYFSVQMKRVYRLQKELQSYRHETIGLKQEISTLKGELRVSRNPAPLERELQSKMEEVAKLEDNCRRIRKKINRLTSSLNRPHSTSSMPQLIPDDLEQ